MIERVPTGSVAVASITLSHGGRATNSATSNYDFKKMVVIFYLCMYLFGGGGRKKFYSCRFLKHES